MLQEKKKKNTFVAENAENTEGEMLEWLKRQPGKRVYAKSVSGVRIPVSPQK